MRKPRGQNVGTPQRGDPTRTMGIREKGNGEMPDQRLAMAFLPVHKPAFGLAVGLSLGFLILVLTLANLVIGAAHYPLMLLSELFYGYSVSVRGAVIGMFWGTIVGVVAGWFLAFIRNLAVATFIFVIRARAELRATRDFLDHL
jgi:hypothetical protein